MFCPKCGTQNANNARFCRSCGADLSNVLAVVEGNLPEFAPPAKENNDLFISGIRNLILGFGFLFVALLLFTIPGNTFYWLLLMIPAIALLASGIPRIVKAVDSKANIDRRAAERPSFPASPPNPALPPVQTEYVKPERSIYQTDDLASEPYSVTESQTRLLEIDAENETARLAEK